MNLTRQQRMRLGVLLMLVCLFFTTAVARLIHLQVIKGAEYSEIVCNQSQGKVSIPAARGVIYDRNGTIVADNIVLRSLYAYPTSPGQVQEIAAYLERQFGLERGSAVHKFSLTPRKFRWVRRRLDDTVADQIEASAPPGLYLRKESQRSYRFGRVGRQILGFTDIDNAGRAGIELAYDSILAGQTGVADVYRDGLSRTYRVNESALVPPQPGHSLVLTVDWRLQEIVEEELHNAVEKYNAKSGQAVFMDCYSGDILAIAHFDPNEADPDHPTKLRAISDQFEPGSIFKAFTAAGLIDNGTISYTDSVYCENGLWRMGRRSLRDDKKHEWLNFRSIIELSSNIGTAKCAIQMGGEELFETARRFGIGQKQRVGLPGETSGQLPHPNRWSDYTIAALAMGHGVAVNSLQMATGFAAIANGGELLRPNMVLGRVDDEGYIIDRTEREVIARAMERSSADTLHSILRGVVERGTAEPVNSSAVAIAGKTGTAEIPDLENHTYFKNRFMASFAGYFPADNPLIAGIVVLEEPHPVHYGGWTSGPAFRRIAERYGVLYPDLFSAPERTLAEAEDDSSTTSEVPDLVGHTMATARAEAEERGMKLCANADSGYVVWQYPPADRLVFNGDLVMVAVRSADSTAPGMIDLTGLTIRQALAYLDFLGVSALVEGQGKVVRQSMKPGCRVSENDICKLQCRS
ncbi:MAG TPA: penicillin-binding transpeptidase domain-containing protein [candidate division Zixibacteria bacterium]|nr:penicillin-binding transpeptidase domain-containing protein [candidate division Zixibacteria bacterium]